MAFIKNVEDFKCEKCGTDIKGDGFTNHCPNCLYSKHVDNDPGDRKNTCGGLMKPIAYIKMKEKEKITHQCLVCGEEKNNKVCLNDSREAMVTMIKNGIEEN